MAATLHFFSTVKCKDERVSKGGVGTKSREHEKQIAHSLPPPPPLLHTPIPIHIQTEEEWD